MQWTHETSSFLFLPGCCALCRCHTGRRRDICDACENDLPALGTACFTCAIPLPRGPDRPSTELQCGACLKNAPPQDRAYAPFRYTFPLDALVRRFKFQGDLASGRLLGALFAERVPTESRPVLLPVPLHARRLRERGFNQSELLAQDLVARHGYELDSGMIERHRETAVQSGMTAAARRRNVRGAFTLVRRRAPPHVAIVDDVVTTGSTTREIAALCRRAGARRVEVWALARTP